MIIKTNELREREREREREKRYRETEREKERKKAISESGYQIKHCCARIVVHMDSCCKSKSEYLTFYLP